MNEINKQNKPTHKPTKSKQNYLGILLMSVTNLTFNSRCEAIANLFFIPYCTVVLAGHYNYEQCTQIR